MSTMTVKKFVDAVSMAKDIDIAPIHFLVGEDEYVVESMGQFGICADVNVCLKRIKPAVIDTAPVFRRDKRGMISKKMKEIAKSTKGRKEGSKR